MRIGWNGGGHHRSLEAIRSEARQASESGFASFWLSQITGPDALTADTLTSPVSAGRRPVRILRAWVASRRTRG